MTYELAFEKRAKKEWDKLGHTVKTQFKKKLKERLADPHVPSARLSGYEGEFFYKIKLRSAGYRLVYEVKDDEVLVVIVKVGRRDTIYG